MKNHQRLITELLNRMESDSLDFKEAQYRLESPKQKAEFVKDILCMANVPRDESAYILIGVRDRNGRPGEVLGTSDHPDPVKFQDIVNGNTNRSVKFSYTVVNYLQRQLGLLEIPVDKSGPVMLRKGLAGLKTGVIYSRRNAQNCEADAQEMQWIFEWYDQQRESTETQNITDVSVDAFLRACDHFHPARIFVAILDEGADIASDDAEAFAQVGWKLVVDFDQNADETGLYSKVEASLSKRTALNFTALDSRINPASQSTTIWIAVKGLNSRPSTVQTRTWREWNHVKPPPLLDAMTNLAQATEPNPVTAVIFGGETEYVSTICELLDRSFKRRLSFVFANDQADEFMELGKRFEGTAIEITFPAACAAIRSLRSATEVIDTVELPRRDGGLTTVPPDRARWLEEELEIVHTNVGIEPSSSGTELQEFLKGNPISWYGLSLAVDVERRITSGLQQRVQGDLENRRTRTVNLWHRPGGGGSTVARRIAWNLHNQFPVVMARRVIPDALRDRLQYVFSLTQNPVLVLVEESITNSDDVNRLYERLRSGNVPVVVLRIGRRETPPSQPGSFFLDGRLNRNEAAAFAGRLINEVPERRQELLNLRARDSHLRTPFYFGLVAFGKDFVGLAPYVSHRLTEASTQMLEVCELTSFLYHFGQQSTPVQLLSSILSRPRDELIEVHSIMPDLLWELFVEDANRSIRPAHELIANEILVHILGRGLGDRRNWISALADSSVQAIQRLADFHDNPGGTITDLVRSVVIERRIQEETSESSEGQFSDLIERIPSADGQRRVLEQLTVSFPDEAHFWAHLGRFYAIRTRDYALAHDRHNKALEIAPTDHVLHHMAGMAVRRELYDLLDIDAPKGLPEFEPRIRSLSEAALRMFAKSRSLDTTSEHSYISGIELIVRVVKSVGRLKGYTGSKGDTADFLVSREGEWYRELIDVAETLVAELAIIRTGVESDPYFRRVRANLSEAYGDISKAIQGWDNLLHPRSGAYRPPLRRNIINALLNRERRNWTQLQSKDLHRIFELAQENLDEEPNSDQNLRLWFRAARATGEVPLDSIAERLTYKSFRNPTIDTVYYLYIIKFLQADLGAGYAAEEARNLIEECARLAAELPHRTQSFEWLGSGAGIRSLVHQSSLGSWNPSLEFWSETKLLKPATGRISSIRTPHSSGEIELPNGLKAFFVPSRGRIEGGYLPGRDIGRRVQFFLGFSYDGLRAWSVGEIDSQRDTLRSLQNDDVTIGS